MRSTFATMLRGTSLLLMVAACPALAQTEAQAAADAAAQAADAWEVENHRKPKDRWWTFYADDTREIAFDTETATKNGKDWTVWERTRFAKPQASGTGETYVEDMTRATYYCGSRQKSFDQYTWRDANGLVVYSRQLKSYEVIRRDMAPETIGEEMYKAACES